MHYSNFALAGWLLAVPLLSRGQSPTTEPAPAPRFYVGLAAFHSNFQNVWSWRQGDTGFRVPVQFTAGYQLRPRLALELGVAYSGNSNAISYGGYYANIGGIGPGYYQYSNTTTRRVTNVSALARYTLTRQPTKRFQVDALGGLTLVHGNFYSRGVQSNDLSGSLQTYPYAVRNTDNELLLTAGLGLRYRLAPRFELNFDLTTNRNLNHPHVYDGFTGSAALGVRYRLGPR
jgi:hypothetical protein